MYLVDKTVVITGAGGGLGKPLAEAFAGKGAQVIAIDSSRENLDKSFNSPNRLIKIVELNLLDEIMTINVLSKVEKECEKIDILCAVAGGFDMGHKVHETPTESWESMLDINIRTLMNTIKAITPGMVKRGAGKIITIGANAAKAGMPDMGAYCAAKSAVMRLTESMALELRPRGINVNCLLPSIIDTKANRDAMPNLDPKKWVDPNDLSEVAVFLASPEANAIHGALIPVVGLS